MPIFKLSTLFLPVQWKCNALFAIREFFPTNGENVIFHRHSLAIFVLELNGEHKRVAFLKSKNNDANAQIFSVVVKLREKMKSMANDVRVGFEQIIF